MQACFVHSQPTKIQPLHFIVPLYYDSPSANYSYFPNICSSEVTGYFFLTLPGPRNNQVCTIIHVGQFFPAFKVKQPGVFKHKFHAPFTTDFKSFWHICITDGSTGSAESRSALFFNTLCIATHRSGRFRIILMDLSISACATAAPL